MKRLALAAILIAILSCAPDDTYEPAVQNAKTLTPLEPVAEQLEGMIVLEAPGNGFCWETSWPPTTTPPVEGWRFLALNWCAPSGVQNARIYWDFRITQPGIGYAGLELEVLSVSTTYSCLCCNGCFTDLVPLPLPQSEGFLPGSADEVVFHAEIVVQDLEEAIPAQWWITDSSGTAAYFRVFVTARWRCNATFPYWGDLQDFGDLTNGIIAPALTCPGPGHEPEEDG